MTRMTTWAVGIRYPNGGSGADNVVATSQRQAFGIMRRKYGTEVKLNIVPLDEVHADDRHHYVQTFDFIPNSPRAPGAYLED